MASWEIPKLDRGLNGQPSASTLIREVLLPEAKPNHQPSSDHWGSLLGMPRYAPIWHDLKLPTKWLVYLYVCY